MANRCLPGDFVTLLDKVDDWLKKYDNPSGLWELLTHRESSIVHETWPEVLEDDETATKAHELAREAYRAGLAEAGKVRALAEAYLAWFEDGNGGNRRED
ncbi:MAG TPA: hypothetical protein GX513_02255 [Firmicutes bacterium]|nr:hypothetical protein [Bacillota bacterium]